MQAFIHEKTHRFFRTFKRRMKKHGKLCDCKTLTYEGGDIPDYENKILQPYYLLRYFPAYLAEYYLMYKKMLRSLFLKNQQLKVLSIGCGSGIDLWGLYFAIKNKHLNPDEKIDYTGVDLVNWRYFDNMELEDVYFYQKNIADWEEMDEDNYNVIVFPKSIGEFSVPDFASLCKMFENTTFSEDRICVLCSLMELGRGSDMNRCKKIANILTKKHGYSCLDDTSKYWHYKEAGIRKYCWDFVYPDNIKNYLDGLQRHCPTYIENGNVSCKDDCDNLNRSPILKTTYINYSMLRFKR
ncbi:hypothetical protein ACFL54_06970 [Planctomycetota bacterium]